MPKVKQIVRLTSESLTWLSHSQQASLLKQLVRELIGLLEFHNIPSSLIVPLICIVSLAARHICPQFLRNSVAYKLLRHLSRQWGGQSLLCDDTKFATVLLKPCQPLIESNNVSIIFEKISSILSHYPLYLFNDVLLAGWSYQFLRQHQLKTYYQSASLQDNPLQKINTLTQWFTPEWIARFLVEETLQISDQVERPLPNIFLDPACGAGHILVHALTHLFNIRLKYYGDSVEDAISWILTKELFGLDIDTAMIDLAGFSLYLKARDLTKVAASYPIPQLYSFHSHTETEQTLGSLYLGAETSPSRLSLRGLDGQSHSLDILPKQYTAIATNPPYLSRRSMPSIISDYLKENYSLAQYDLYAAFIELCRRITAPGTRFGMIAQQSFLSTQRYAQLRSLLVETCNFQSVVQLGSGSFAAKAGEKVNNAIVILHKHEDIIREHPSGTRCWRILSKSEKQQAEDKGITRLPHTIAGPNQVLSPNILAGPLLFWCPPEVIRLFHIYPPFENRENAIKCVNGLFTCNNHRFVRNFDADDIDAKDYVPYDKGGGQKWYCSTPYLVYWRDKGMAIRQYRIKQGQSGLLPGEQYYFKDGVTYSYIGTRTFKARLLSKNSVFDIASSAVFSDKFSNLYILGFLNSALVRFLLGTLNPTINYQIGDIRRLPFCPPNKNIIAQIENLTLQAVSLAKQLETYNYHSPCFGGPALLQVHFNFRNGQDLPLCYQQYINVLSAINQQEQELQNEIDKIIFAIYDISQESQQIIMQDPWVAHGHEQLIKIPTFKQCLKDILRLEKSKRARDMILKHRLNYGHELIADAQKLIYKIQ